MSPSRRGYRITEEAAGDLRNIAAYIGKERPSAAKNVLRTLRVCFRQLAASPQMGSACEELGTGVRHFNPGRPAQRYVIFFRPAKADVSVEVLAVLDGSRNWVSLLRQRRE